MGKLKKIIKKIFRVRSDSQYYYFSFLGVTGKIYSQKLGLRSIRSQLQRCLKGQAEEAKNTQTLMAKTETMEQRLSDLEKRGESFFIDVQKVIEKSGEALSQNMKTQKKDHEQLRKQLKEQQTALGQNTAAISQIAASKKKTAGNTGFLQSCSYVIEPEKLLSNQYFGEDFDALDVIIKYMAIEELEGTGRGGIELYKKMYRARGLESIYTVERLQKLIGSFEKNREFLLNKPIEVSPSGLMMDGAHRLACALYFQCPFVTVTVRSSKGKTRNFGLSYFRESGFSAAELNCIIEKQGELFDRYGCYAAVILWANSRQSRLAFEELLCRNQKLKIVKSNCVCLPKERFLKIEESLRPAALESQIAIDSIVNVYGAEEGARKFYIYWCEVSHSNPRFDSKTGKLDNERIVNFQRSLHLNITEDEAERKGIRLWWLFNTDVKANQDLIASLKGLEIKAAGACLRQELYSLFYGQNQKFGRGQFYQSCPALGISGQRPTEVRLAEYGIRDLLKEHFSVLDIGCNCGFLDIAVAESVAQVTGIDSNESLIQIGWLAAEHLGIKNVSFTASAFDEWETANTMKFHAIFSFAVHYWLNTTPDAYAKCLYQMLKEGGYIFFESQRLETIDTNFDEYCRAFADLGLRVIREGKIKDDGIIERRYLVFQKQPA